MSCLALHLTTRIFSLLTVFNQIVKISKTLQWSKGQTISGRLDSRACSFIVYFRWRSVHVRLCLRWPRCRQSAISARFWSVAREARLPRSIFV